MQPLELGFAEMRGLSEVASSRVAWLEDCGAPRKRD